MKLTITEISHLTHSRALATFQNIGKTRKQGEAILIKYVFCS